MAAPDIIGVDDYNKNRCETCGRVIVGPPELLAAHVREAHNVVEKEKMGKKCRALFGILRVVEWCRLCQLKKKCERASKYEEEMMLMTTKTTPVKNGDNEERVDDVARVTSKDSDTGSDAAKGKSPTFVSMPINAVKYEVLAPDVKLLKGGGAKGC